MGQALENLFASTSTVCPNCGIAYAVPTHWFQAKQTNGSEFYCPNGHRLSYTETTVMKLEKQLANVKQRLEWSEANEKRAREKENTARKAEAIVRGKLRAQSERVKNGVCPCCKRTFAQLAEHMKTKHPEWTGESDP